MPLNQKKPNTKEQVDSFSTGIENLVSRTENINLGDIGNIAKNLDARATYLRSMVNKLDRPILRQMAADMLSSMSSWLEDPEVLCCLIHAIWGAYTSSAGEPERQLRIADTKFGDFLNMFISFIDLTIVLLTDDVRKIKLYFPDIISELVNSIMGAVILAVQETLYSLRDSVIASIFEWIDDKDTDATWARCLPVKNLLNILKKYTHDHGLFATLMEKIKGYTSGLRLEWSKVAELPSNARDLEFLFWLRNLLIRLKQAVLNFDFCVDYEFVPASDSADQTTVGSARHESVTGKISESPNFSQVSSTPKSQGYTTGADGTVIVDPSKVSGDNGVWLSRVSNSFIREFLNKEFNLPYDVIDNTITKTVASDSVQGTNIRGKSTEVVQDLCSFTPTAKQTLSWMLNIRNRMS